MVKEAHDKKIEKENGVKDNRSRISIVRERRRVATLKNMKTMFLRGQKKQEKVKKEKFKKAKLA